MTLCQNCQGELRRVYPGRRKQTDCWAHVSGSTLWCPGRTTVATPPPPPARPPAEANPER